MEKPPNEGVGTGLGCASSVRSGSILVRYRTIRKQSVVVGSRGPVGVCAAMATVVAGYAGAVAAYARRAPLSTDRVGQKQHAGRPVGAPPQTSRVAGPDLHGRARVGGER